MSRKSRRKLKHAATPPPILPPDPPKLTTGRNSLLTPAVRDRIVAAVLAGLPLTFVGPRCGVSRSVLFAWLAKGRTGKDEACVDLLDAVKAAQADFVESTLTTITGHTHDTWQAAAWLLERMFRADFGGDKLELNQLKKELRELRALVVQVPRETQGDAERSGEAQGGGDGPAAPSAPKPPA